MKYFLSYLLCTLGVYFPPHMLSAALRIDRSSNVDEFIDKLLKSDKFDELANKIADKAAEKIKSYQSGNKSENNKVKKELNYRVSAENYSAKNDSAKDGIEIPKLKGNELKNIINRDPFSNLTLKYVKFLKKNSGKDQINIKGKTQEDKEDQSNGITITKHSNENVTKKKKKRKGIQKLGSNIENNNNKTHKSVKTKIKKNSEAKEKLKKMKTSNIDTNSDSKSAENSKDNSNLSLRSDENELEKKSNKNSKKIDKNLGSVENKIAKETDKNSNEINYKSVTETYNMTLMPNNVYQEKEIDANISSSETKVTGSTENEAKKDNGSSNKTNTESKRMLQKANDRLYVLETSSDYDVYRDEIYDALGSH